MSHTLQGIRPQVAAEVAATKAAWPLVANGLPPASSRLARAAIQRASREASRLRLPALFHERPAASITGPGSPLASLFRSYAVLSERGWRLIAGSIAEIENGTPASARFARENVALYIDAVYDAHFLLAQIGKQLAAGYKNHGGQAMFESSLSQAEVDQLASFYSEPSDRLAPHPAVRVGS